MNIKELYDFGRQALSNQQFENPGLEASLLLLEATGIDKLNFYKNHDRLVNGSEIDKYKELIDRRLSNEPVAYILGKREFYSRQFAVDENVLIPRPETELLVDKAVMILRGLDKPSILDVGTGSGCITVTLKAEIPDSQCVATDISCSALQKAKQNSKSNDCYPFFIRGNLLESIKDCKFDLIVSNPPYVREELFYKLDKGVRNYEPKSALVAGDGGLSIISQIITGSKRVLKNEGWCLLEIGFDQSGRVVEMFELNGYTEIEIFKDLSGIDRVIKAKWKK
jgi:release factor glutamine methyltransferase